MIELFPWRCQEDDDDDQLKLVEIMSKTSRAVLTTSNGSKLMEFYAGWLIILCLFPANDLISHTKFNAAITVLSATQKSAMLLKKELSSDDLRPASDRVLELKMVLEMRGSELQRNKQHLLQGVNRAGRQKSAVKRGSERGEISRLHTLEQHCSLPSNSISTFTQMFLLVLGEGLPFTDEHLLTAKTLSNTNCYKEHSVQYLQDLH
nr:hypothetical protein Iba_chr10aCG6240 [Ipomoea batatas]